MPRVSRERTKHHASTRSGPAVVGNHRQTPTPPSNFFASVLPTATPDIASAPISLTAALSDTASSTNPTLGSKKEPVSKKGKRVERHKKWIDKLATAQSQKRQEQRHLSRQTDPSALVRGMSQIHHSLRDIQAEIMASDLLSLDTNKNKQNAQQKANIPVSRKARARAAVKEEQRFAQVLQHPAFKADALATIREHLSNTLSKPTK
ncbi:hypothetical protein IWW43_003799 [Coemansia sp. RSA 1935]|nr:hypothetical protein J3F81_003037 [Coemansia sp. RSA 371]KAJ2531363.1 hypothetical protein IWW43_003799 [Coemansia sp. RSA 1935]